MKKAIEKSKKLNYAWIMDKEYPSTSSRNNKKRWNAFVIENSGLFLQSWEWGEFQKSLGRKIWRLQDENFQSLIIKYDLPLGKNYLYCPGGPVINSKFKIQNSKLQSKMQKLLEEAGNIAEQEKSIFLKVEPFWEKEKNLNLDSRLPSVAKSFGRARRGNDNDRDAYFKKSSGGQRILQTLILNLNKSEEELLAEMKQKTRYNIRLAEKRGIKIRISNEPEKDIEYFWQLAKETSQRDGFHFHLREYYESMVNFFRHNWMPDQVRHDNVGWGLEVRLFLAEYNGKIIAANIVVFFGNRAIYLHGASANEHRNLMAPYLLQWEQIKEAKKQGCEIYDFWGIDETKWAGVTRFKTGFGGKEIEYIGAYDYVFQPWWYVVYKGTKKILGILRQ